MDAFYASVELLRYADLRGQPVVVGGRREQQPVTLEDGSRRYARLRDYVGRGVITTATYEARSLGVRSGMGVMKAARLAPEAILLPVDFDAYRHYSRLFKRAVAEIAPLIEDRGIDEIYIDLEGIPGSSESIALRIKMAVRAATGLGCSIGVAPNKLLAKICSELDKPDGITVLLPADIGRRIWPLPVAKINGIGPKATARLAMLGIASIGDLAGSDPSLLLEQFGRSYGRWLHEAANGIDERPVVTSSEPKSISRESTFERDLHPVGDRSLLSGIFTGLCQQLAADLERKGYLGRTIAVKLRFDDFRTLTRGLTLPAPVADATAIRRAAGECLRRIPLERRIRLLGVRAENLCRANAAPMQEAAAQGRLALGD